MTENTQPDPSGSQQAAQADSIVKAMNEIMAEHKAYMETLKNAPPKAVVEPEQGKPVVTKVECDSDKRSARVVAVVRNEGAGLLPAGRVILRQVYKDGSVGETDAYVSIDLQPGNSARIDWIVLNLKDTARLEIASYRYRDSVRSIPMNQTIKKGLVFWKLQET
ncbi:hypothetical protein PQR66_11520 [Paraburkholderia agricolaris]|uniref:Uncharacterized protein n=1 Tax=Paraburkholderia agricolaris TaxID=2152888 RepID=A0ABW8ZKA9_9BURK